MTACWTLADMPDLTGRRALVTGVTSGLGRHVALELARRGAEVVLAARSEAKLDGLVGQLCRTLPTARVRPLRLDLADLKSVRRAAAEASSYGPLDVLVNNAGVMAAPHRSTVDGFELHYGTNHLGHFALTGLLLPQLAASGGARVVTVSSQFHRAVRSVPLGDRTMHSGHYQRWIAYARSKLANLLFAFELQRRATAAGSDLLSLAAHPGYAATELHSKGAQIGGASLQEKIMGLGVKLGAQSSADGAWPMLYAATAPGVPGGAFVGPSKRMETIGPPKLTKGSAHSRDEAAARRLWEVSEQLTGVHYAFEAPALS